MSSDELNSIIQKEINPENKIKPELYIGENKVFRVKDRVIQTKNITKTLANSRYDSDRKKAYICNGDVGVILDIFKSDGIQYTKIDFGYGRIVDLDREEMYDVDLAYALSVHKSQGSEYKIVFSPMTSSTSKKLLSRNLLYTDVTRAKKHFVAVGSERVLRYCINNSATKRSTALARRIVEAIEN